MALSKDERERGYRMAPKPSNHVTAILRRVAAGTICVTHGSDGPVYTYEDGTVVRDHRGEKLGKTTFNHMVSRGWLIPLEGGSFLKDGPPQQYRARRPSDPPLPRIF